MPTPSPVRVKPAPIWRRVAAWLINALITIGVGASALVAGYATPDRLVERLRGDRLVERLRAVPKPPPRLLPVLGPVLTILFRNVRGPAYRVMGLRHADARTGGPVTLRSALIGAAISAVTTALVRPGQAAFRERVKRVEEQVHDVEQRFAEDREARVQATTRLIKDSNINPLSSFGWSFAAGLVTNFPLPGPKRSLREIVTGTVVVETD
jgi:uncharacterized RDD family membrane protein YckC